MSHYGIITLLPRRCMVMVVYSFIIFWYSYSFIPLIQRLGDAHSLPHWKPEAPEALYGDDCPFIHFSFSDNFTLFIPLIQRLGDAHSLPHWKPDVSQGVVWWWSGHLVDERSHGSRQRFRQHRLLPGIGNLLRYLQVGPCLTLLSHLRKYVWQSHLRKYVWQSTEIGSIY